MTEQDQRDAVVMEARSWLRTPYHHRARIKGSGVDCAWFILESFTGAGVHPEWFDLGSYTHDWHLHRNEEKYLAVIEEHMARLDQEERPFKEREVLPELHPGDVLVWRHGRTFSHGAIVTKWPFVIHSFFPARMVIEERVLNNLLWEKPVRAYSYWGSR